jgi:glycine cleavage system H protein
VTAAPDFCEAIVGYRAWHVDGDGVLRPWTITGHPWRPGINVAACFQRPWHEPPVAECMCGLYALSDPSDRRLCFRGDQVVGAIAAWGDVEAHRTGFRAQFACVVALARPEGMTEEAEARLDAAGRRYRVPVVPAAMLSLEARRHGSPLPDLWGPPAAAPPWAEPCGVPPLAFSSPERGLAADSHVWVETSLGGVALGITSALADTLEPAARVDVAAPGAALRAGDRLATIGTVGVFAPLSGRVVTVNPAVLADPSLVRSDPEGAGWVARVLPDRWEDEARDLLWGRGARSAYAADLARSARFGDPFSGVRLETLRAAPPVRSWRDVGQALGVAARRPRYASAQEAERDLEQRIGAALRANPTLRDRLGRVCDRIAWRMREPKAEVVMDLGGSGRPPLVFEARADIVERLLCGRLDPAAALRRGDLRSSRPATEALRALTVLKELRIQP